MARKVIISNYNIIATNDVRGNKYLEIFTPEASEEGVYVPPKHVTVYLNVVELDALIYALTELRNDK